MPPAAATLGLQFIRWDVASGTIELAFDARAEFTNPVGNVLGAFVAAMLYDTVGPALLATLRPDEFQSTHHFAVHFLQPVHPGRLVGKGRVVARDGSLAHLEGSLFNAESQLVATATAIARVIALNEAPNAV
jgi:uncharacterized protein (TIGR00369 family)